MATHLAASLKAVAAHTHRPKTSISDARDAVLLATQYVLDGDADADTLALVSKLERVTGCGIIGLARHATSWHDGMTDEIDSAAFDLWMVKDERTGQLRVSTDLMDQATARKRHPGATPILSTKETSNGRGQGAGSIGTRRPTES